MSQMVRDKGIYTAISRAQACDILLERGVTADMGSSERLTLLMMVAASLQMYRDLTPAQYATTPLSFPRDLPPKPQDTLQDIFEADFG
jgi:hypothetical protein